MKKLIYYLFLAAGLFTTGFGSGTPAVQAAAPAIRQLDASSPAASDMLYFSDVQQSQRGDTLIAAHYSHRSHSSHRSHYSSRY